MTKGRRRESAEMRKSWLQENGDAAASGGHGATVVKPHTTISPALTVGDHSTCQVSGNVRHTLRVPAAPFYLGL